MVFNATFVYIVAVNDSFVVEIKTLIDANKGVGILHFKSVLNVQYLQGLSWL
jgi:hypothetical protein